MLKEGYAIVHRHVFAPLFSNSRLYLTDKPAASPLASDAKLFRTWQEAVAERATLNDMWQCLAQVVYLTEFDTQRPN